MLKVKNEKKCNYFLPSYPNFVMDVSGNATIVNYFLLPNPHLSYLYLFIN